MKLLQINSTLNWGSTGRIAEEIGQAAMANDWDSSIAYGRYANATQSHPIQIGNKWDVYSHVLQTRLFDRHGLASVGATKQLIEQLKGLNPDIIHLHNIHGYYLNYPLLFEYLAAANRPVVWTLHDCWLFTGHCSYYSAYGCQRWKMLCHHCPQKKEYPQSLLLDRSSFNFREKLAAFTSVKSLTLVPVSQWLANEVKQSFLKDFPIRVIHNGIDTNVFTPQTVDKKSVGIGAKFMILGVASVWSPRKGLDDFIRLRKLLPDDCLIVLLGLTDKQIKKLPAGIVGIKRTNSVQELAQYYSAADVFFNPTWEDNFPTTNLEALSCGTPVVTYRTGGSVEAIDADTGFVVEQGDLTSVVDIVRKLQESGKDSFRDACRSRAVRMFDKNGRYAEYIHLYNELLGR